MLEIIVKKFEDLNTRELYAILKLRNEVFVVEQNCVYQDLDGKDDKALHVIGLKENKIIAYTRIFRPNDYAKMASIGRVVVKRNQRKYGYGKVLLKDSIRAVEAYFNETTIHVSAQLYLERFYEELGFAQIGDSYLEDGIPHIGMIRKSNT
ncbi:GNAT family N-acetyltransferase [uncultured Kriegella sp.]|uniref:GNAT family N-acetyltransferase n=1 Tax=uncultured Kriegella sp. TaxID=1798910 RepID=UPI0030DBB80A|tara:strand:- start:85124 stop:85576 length:453 start_codon:yes stop_codon:yes gene_type:complete